MGENYLTATEHKWLQEQPIVIQSNGPTFVRNRYVIMMSYVKSQPLNSQISVLYFRLSERLKL